jgi:outer membrane protein TolC
MSESIPKMPTQADIAKRAYEIYERRNREHGSNLADWVQAEQELREEYRQALQSLMGREPESEEQRKTQSA